MSFVCFLSGCKGVAQQFRMETDDELRARFIIGYDEIAAEPYSVRKNIKGMTAMKIEKASGKQLDEELRRCQTYGIFIREKVPV